MRMFRRINTFPFNVFFETLIRSSCYSAQEHAALSASLVQHLSSQQSSPNLPIDICIETVLATLVVCIGLVLSSPQPRPIRWTTWAGKIEREGAAGFRNSGGEVDKDFRGNPFRALESRQGFVDIRKQRREFADWAKGNE
jgi:hypothetical protein